MSDSSLKYNTTLTNGQAGAAILAAGVGSAALGVLALAGDALPAVNHALAIYRPTGALSGVTTGAIVIWLAVWFGLERRWRGKQIDFWRINVGALALLVVGILLTFPPFMDFVQGK
jgi:hypothetical protein